MKKKIISLWLLLAMLIANSFAVNLYVDGGKLNPDVAPTIISGRTLVPLRSIFEALNASVTWDDATNTAVAQKGDTTVKVSINNKTAYVNSSAKTLDVPAQLINNRTMVPARFVSESLNARVLWDGNTETVYVITNDHATLVVEYLDVGQADSILLSSGGEYMLIDAGNNDDGDDVVAYLRKVGANELKYAVGTHPHEDHIGGLDDVINSLNVKNVLLPNATTTTKAYGDVLDAIESKGLRITVPKQGETYRLGNTNITVVSAQTSNELNNTSIVLKATYKNTSFLFMGDAETEVENTILSSGINIKSDVLKVGHHGSYTSTGSDFLKAVNPKVAIISCGAENSYGHPHQSTLDKLSGKAVWRTDINGTVIAMTDGQNCSVTSDKGSVSTVAPTTPSTSTITTPSVTTPPTTNNNTQQVDSTPSTVYVTPTGKRYHYSSSCAGKNAQSSSIANAKSRGLTPCQKCAA